MPTILQPAVYVFDVGPTVPVAFDVGDGIPPLFIVPLFLADASCIIMKTGLGLAEHYVAN